MMNWFWQWMHKKIERSLMEGPSEKRGLVVATRSQDIGSANNTINFQLVIADGGVILQRNKYDPRTDHSDHKTYLIPDSENVSERIADILSMEMLRGV